MHDLRLCPCGRVHVVHETVIGRVMGCPLAPAYTFTLWSDRYLPEPAVIHVPRPETVW